MSTDLYYLTLSPTGENPTIAGGRIASTGQVFRFEFNNGRARLFVYPDDRKPANLTHFESFCRQFPANDAFLVIDRTIGIGDADNRAGRALVNGLLTHWICAFINGTLKPVVSLASLRALASASHSDKLAEEAARRRADRERQEAAAMERARKVIEDLPQLLQREAAKGTAVVDVWILQTYRYDYDPEDRPAMPEPSSLVKYAKFVWDACAPYEPRIGGTSVCGDEYSGSYAAYAIQIVLRPGARH